MKVPSVSTADLVRWDKQHLWHPFTQMREWMAGEPIIIERGEGNYLIDTEGRHYLDGVSSLWCNVHGHRKRELDDALRTQVDKIAHSTMLGLGNVPATLLAKRLTEIVPRNLTRVFYSDAGATAVEVALKMALQYWQLVGQPLRTRFIGLTEAYHGDTLGAVGVGYSDTFHRFFRPVVTPALVIRPPHVFRWQLGHSAEEALELAIADAKAVLGEHGSQCAALIAEPLMQGAAGMWSQPPAYLTALRELTRAHGTLLICDEVATGFGRTGRMFAIDHAAVEPDLLCVGKGITGGYLPLAATFASEQIFDAFLAPYEKFEAFFHGHTYTGNPLACAVALASLDVFESESVIDRVQVRSTFLSKLLTKEIAPLQHVGDIRQHGLMVGIELVRNRTGRVPFDPAERIGHRVILEIRKHGIIVRPLGNVVVLMPPLSVTEPEIGSLVEVLKQAVVAITG